MEWTSAMARLVALAALFGCASVLYRHPLTRLLSGLMALGVILDILMGYVHLLAEAI